MGRRCWKQLEPEEMAVQMIGAEGDEVKTEFLCSL